VHYRDHENDSIRFDAIIKPTILVLPCQHGLICHSIGNISCKIKLSLGFVYYRCPLAQFIMYSLYLKKRNLLYAVLFYRYRIHCKW